MSSEVPDFPFDGRIPQNGVRIIAEETPPKGYSLKFEEFPIQKSSNSKKILIELVCAPINYADLLNARGYYGLKKPNFPLKMGFEGLFRVVSNANNPNLEVGDYVLINKYDIGTWATHLEVNATDVVKLPKNIDPVSCSMMRVNFYTAYRLLKDFINLDEGNIVVQNGANSHVGVNVIQICKDLGYKCVNIIRDDSEMSRQKEFKVFGDCNIIGISNPENVKISDLIKQLESKSWFNQSKVKLGLNCIGDEYSKIVQDLIAPDSFHVTYGALKNSRSMNSDIKSLIFKNIKFCGFSMNTWLGKHRFDSECHKMHDYILNLIHGGTYYRHPFTCVPLLDVENAVKHFHNNQNSPFHNRILLTRDVHFNQNALTLIKKMIK